MQLPVQSSFPELHNNYLLLRYAHHFAYPEEKFFGLDYTPFTGACTEVLTKSKRDTINRALIKSAELIGEVLGSFIFETWITNERHPVKTPLIRTRYAFVKALGEKVVETIETVSLVFDTDPAYFELLTTENSDDLHIFFEDTEIEIIPSSVIPITGGYRFYIPWARLIAPEKQENPETGWAYEPLYLDSVYVASVVIKKITTGGTVATLSRPNCTTCDDTTVTLDCSSIIDGDNGLVRIQSSNPYSLVKLNYLTHADMNESIWSAILELAHSKMTTEPCLCDDIRYQWERARAENTESSGRCPFGESIGAWNAWVITNREKKLRTYLI